MEIEFHRKGLKDRNDSFCALFNMLKLSTDIIPLFIRKDGLFIQGMNKSQVGLFQLFLAKDWWEKYDYTSDKDSFQINMNLVVFSQILNNNNSCDIIKIVYNENEADKINIEAIYNSGNNNNLVKSQNYLPNKTYELCLFDLEYEQMETNNNEYDAEFSINSKCIENLISEAKDFGDSLMFHCTDSVIHLNSKNLNSEVKIEIPIDELSEYSIIEDQAVSVSISIQYLYKSAITSKLSNLVNIYIKEEIPIKINYNLDDFPFGGEDANSTGSYLEFYIAPKFED
jgi:proliferating cell nuclear antigen PCNA